MRGLFILLLGFCLTAAPAWAEEEDVARPRLVTGGMGKTQNTELLNFGAASLGTVNEPTAGGHMLLGGYAAYSFEDVRLQSSLQWGHGLDHAFSPNPLHGGLMGLGNNDVSLTLSFTHDVSPSFSLGGYAATARGEDAHDPSALRLGAGLGLKF
jgi:hypothetical protein